MNVEGFVIQKKGEDLRMQDLGYVAANQLREGTYTFQDRAPSGLRQVYRIKQLDFDGKYSYSPWIEVEMAYTQPKVSFSPEGDQLFVQGLPFEQGEISLWDMQGRQLRQARWAAPEESLSLSIGPLPGGIYLLQFRREGQLFQVIKVLKS